MFSMGKEEGVYETFEEELASELVGYGLDLLDNFPASEKDDILIAVMIEALGGLLLAYKIMNPTISHKQILDEVCMKIKQDFFSKAGKEDFTIDLSCVN